MHDGWIKPRYIRPTNKFKYVSKVFFNSRLRMINSKSGWTSKVGN